MNRFRLFQFSVFFLLLVCCFPKPAAAYVGPGTGMSAIGVFLAVVMAAAVAFIGFIWYPVKRLLRSFRRWSGATKGEHTA
jgi:hypothetical protein